MKAIRGYGGGHQALLVPGSVFAGYRWRHLYRPRALPSRSGELCGTRKHCPDQPFGAGTVCGRRLAKQ